MKSFNLIAVSSLGLLCACGDHEPGQPGNSQLICGVGGSSTSSSVRTGVGGSSTSSSVRTGVGGSRTTDSGGPGGSGGTSGSGTATTTAVVDSLLGLCSQAEVPASDCSASELFDWKSVPVFDLSLPAEDWQALKQNARAERFTQAELVFEGHRIGSVALRFKGSYGTLEDCFDANDNLTCKKLSMKLKFSEYEPDKRFFGLKRLNFHSLIADSTYLHDRLGYRLYRDMGIIAPRSSWATVRVNGASQGLYAMVEEIDGVFAKDRWPADGEGNLYKEVSTTNEDPGYFADQLQTNEDTAQNDAIVAFTRALNAATPQAQRGVLGTYMDLEALASYMAVDDAINNWDGVSGVYTDPKSSWRQSHNFYFYQETTRPFFWLIPWDLDNTFAISTGFGLVPNWTQTPADCEKLIPVFGGAAYVVPPGCLPFFQALKADLSSYRAAVQRLLAGPFSDAVMLPAIDRDAAFIAAAVAADPLGPGTQAWTASVAQLKRDLPNLRERLAFISSGEIVTPMTVSANVLNDFEAMTTVSAKSGPLMMVNSGSVGVQSINTADPLSGARDLRIDFEYRNTAKAWDQWMYFSIPLTESTFDVSGLTGIRIKVRASASRNLRVELESPAQTATAQGIRVGWDVNATKTAKTVDLKFANAKVPDWAVDQGTDPQDDLNAIRASVTGLAFHPYCIGRDSSGFLPEGEADVGWVQIDDIQFY